MAVDKENGVQVGRLAMRQEGGHWVAYFAPTDTMVTATMLGSIKINLIIKNPKRRAAYMDMMRDCVGDMIEDLTGHRPEWGGEETAPEHERSGSA